MKTRTVYAALAFCLSVAPAALAQAPVNIPSPTPEQQAVTAKAVQLTHDAAASLHAGHYAQAEEEARQALSLNDFGVPDEILAAALAAEGKNQEALTAYQTVVEHYDRNPRNLLPYAQLLLKSG